MLHSVPIRPIYTVIFLLATGIFPTLSSAGELLEGDKKILLSNPSGEFIQIGSLSFQPQGESSRYQLHLDHQRFTDYFLSMKEMKCLEGPELWCHLPYPYQQPRTVTRDDLRWLEHDLLFMFKKKGEFGANFWNGIYYHLRVENGMIVGEAEAVDLNLLASPPDELTQPPIEAAERDPLDRANRWLPDIEIR